MLAWLYTKFIWSWGSAQVSMCKRVACVWPGIMNTPVDPTCWQRVSQWILLYFILFWWQPLWSKDVYLNTSSLNLKRKFFSGSPRRTFLKVQQLLVVKHIRCKHACCVYVLSMLGAHDSIFLQSCVVHFIDCDITSGKRLATPVPFVEPMAI